MSLAGWGKPTGSPHGEERASLRASRTMSSWHILRDAAKTPLLRMRNAVFAPGDSS
jgi:hypothetical protein